MALALSPAAQDVPFAAVQPGAARASESYSTNKASGFFAGGGNPTLDPHHWALWWGYNREPFLDIKSFVQIPSVATTSEYFFLGRGDRGPGPIRMRPSDEQLNEQIVPALIHALENDRFDDVQSAALIALAKIGDREGSSVILADILKPYLTHPNEMVSEVAALSVGILADERAAFLLSDLLHDTPAGRSALGETEVPIRTRAFAAYGLGMVGSATRRLDVRRYIVHKLDEALDTDIGGTQDIEVACMLAMGLIPLPPGRDTVPLAARADPPPACRSLSAQIRWLADIYTDPSRDVLVRAHAPVSMARLATTGDDALRAQVAEILLPSLKPFARVRWEQLQGAVMGLGLIGDLDDDEIDQRIRRDLMRVARKEDALTRSIASMSLGRLSARSVPGSEAGLEQVRSFLLGKLANETGVQRPWAALALAILENGVADAGGRKSEAVLVALQDSLDKAVSIDEAGGLCIALGIAEATPAAADLLDLLERWDEDYAEGNAAIGLGMMGARQAIEPLRAVLLRSRFRPGLIRSAAISLALLNDKSVVPALVAMLGEAKSLSTQSAIALALGSIGDKRSVDALLTLLKSQEVTASARASAAAALGIVGDKEHLPWNSKLGVDVNYNALVESLTDPATGRGVLDIL